MNSRLPRCYDFAVWSDVFLGIGFPKCSEGIAKMMMSKIAAAIVGPATGAGLLIALAPDFSADFALAVIAYFS